MEFFTSLFFTPILNTKDFPSALIKKDEKGLVRALETVAFPGTVFKGKTTTHPHILEVETKSYPYEGPFYIDKRFTQEGSFDKKSFTPGAEAILQEMKRALGSSYIWGGNSLELHKLSSLYPKASLNGFDCSGLIYFASKGTTPRNTSSWLDFGESIPIAGKNIQEILPLLQPLDAIVWKGHILFVFNEKNTIESCEGEGVVLKNIEQRLSSLVKEGKKPSNIAKKTDDYFLIKRWISP